jgi:hypothetical protein
MSKNFIIALSHCLPTDTMGKKLTTHSHDLVQRPVMHAASLICLIYTLMLRCLGTGTLPFVYGLASDHIYFMSVINVTIIRYLISNMSSIFGKSITCRCGSFLGKTKYYSKVIITRNESFPQLGLQIHKLHKVSNIRRVGSFP